jgi:hypothetical protein
MKDCEAKAPQHFIINLKETKGIYVQTDKGDLPIYNLINKKLELAQVAYPGH